MITLDQIKKYFRPKDRITNILLANIPATILVAFFDIKDTITITVLTFTSAVTIRKIREKKKMAGSYKTILYAMLFNFIIFFMIPLLYKFIFK
ncbi:MAG: hypothetical protein QG614_69 [Patescibacteria group bacterium]|nr:hypothetical protein [Patescibacteria group bacterium]